jgi:hypothetical protein
MSLFEFPDLSNFLWFMIAVLLYPRGQGLKMLAFFALAKYRVVKITCSSSKVVLRTTKHTVIYPSSGPSSEVIALRPAV